VLAFCALPYQRAGAGPPNTQHPTPNTRARLIIVVANRLTLSDLDDPDLPSVSRLFRLGSVGLVSPNCLKPRSENAVLMTASAGASCSGGPFVGEFHDADERVLKTDEKASSAYATRTGREAPAGSALFLGLGPAMRAVGEDGRAAHIGAIGDALHRAGMKTCVIGNADLDPEKQNRAASVLAMDSRGLIDIGRLTAPVGPTDACGLSIHADRLADTAVQCLRSADLVVVNFGDSTRLDEMKISLSDAAYADHKLDMMLRLDNLVGRLAAARDRDFCAGIVLVSFTPPQTGYWNRLTPIVVLFRDRQPHLLTSPTTRTPGLIAASDFPVVVLRGLGLSRSRLFSRGEIKVLHVIDTRVTANHTLILPIIWVFAGIGAVVLTVAALIIAFRRPISRRLSLALRFGLLIPGSACLAMLLAVLAPPGVTGYATGTIVIAFVASTVALLIGRASAVRLIFGATVVAVILDALTGCNLCKFALPSSYQLEGLRYHGIGNEYAAVLVSMSALVALFSGPRVRAALAVALGLVTIAVLGAGNLGSNYGAAAAAVVTFGLILPALRRGGFGARHVIGALLLAASVSLAFAFADWRMSGASATHGGRLVGAGLDGIPVLVARKALMNLRLATSHTAQQAFLAFVPFLALWFWGIQPKAREMIEGDDRLIAGLKALAVGSVVALALNDSGIVMAATMIGMTVLVLIYSLVAEGVEC
jgi:hypothetical protein